jgi:hypothetical protein
MTDPQMPASPEHAGATQVVVTVTTIRYTDRGGMDAVREATATGVFDDAIRLALQQRLADWALEQVLGRVLARRPPAGEPVEYEGWFHPHRQVIVSAVPVGDLGSLPVGRPRQLKGLFLPSRDSAREQLADTSA